MEQNSEEWLLYRRGGLGSSDAPVVMGVSPYLTLYELWLEKQGLFEVKKSDFIMRLGQEFESKARARFELFSGFVVEPEVVEHKDVPWLRASLDACSFEEQIFAEIKYVGLKKFEEIKSGKILEYHYPQIQHQFLVTGFKKGYYIAYTLSSDKKEIENYHCLLVEPDYVYIETLLYPALESFWNMVINKIEPKERALENKGSNRKNKTKKRNVIADNV